MVFLRTAIEVLFDYAFYVIFADHFFNWMPEQYLWYVKIIVKNLLFSNSVKLVYRATVVCPVLLIDRSRKRLFYSQ